MLQHMRLKRYSRPNNLFTSPGIQDQITKCEVDPASRPTSTDHFPIVTHVLLPQERITTSPSYSFRDTNWDDYRKNLRLKLRRLHNEPAITNEEQLNKAAEILTKALQETTKEVVKLSRPKPDAKRWWNNDLKKTKKELNRLRSKSYSYRTLTHHPSHRIKDEKQGIWRSNNSSQKNPLDRLPRRNDSQ